MLPSFSYVRPRSLEQALTLLGKGDSSLHAGGIDLLGCLSDHLLPPPAVLISLAEVAELRGIRRRSDGSLAIGTMTTVAQLAADTEVKIRYPALAQAAAAVASPQLRNQATIGGNLCQKPRCWYYRGEQYHCLRKGGELCFAYQGENQYHCIFGGNRCFMVHPSDLAPALLALGAAVRIAAPAGQRLLPVEQLHVAPGDDPTRETVLAADEIMTEIVLPAAEPDLRSSYRKVRVRAALDFALVGVALALRLDGGVTASARAVFAGVAPVPWPAAGVAAALAGKPLDQQRIAAACAAVVEGAEPLSHNAYKVQLLQGLLRDQLEELAD